MLRAHPEGSLCDGSPCPVRALLQVECPRTLGGAFQLAVTAAGRAFVVMAVNRQAFLLDVAPTGEGQVTPLGDADYVMVAAGPNGDDDPRVLRVFGSPTQYAVGQRDAGRWQWRSGPMEGLPAGFGVNGASEAFALVSGGPSDRPSLSLTPLPPSGPATLVVGDPNVVAWRLVMGVDGRPTVPHVLREKEVVVRRWTEGGTFELARFKDPAAHDHRYVIAPDGRLLRLRRDETSLSVLEDSDAAHLIFAGQPWTSPSCSGSSTAVYPANCPQSTSAEQVVGEQIGRTAALSAVAAGPAVFAAVSGSTTVGCVWAGECIETMACHCQRQAFRRMGVPEHLRLGSTGSGDQARPDVVLTARDFPLSFADRTVALESAAGRFQLAWESWNGVYVALIDMPAPVGKDP